MERQPGFKLTKSFLHRMIQAVVYGDALMQCVLATRPYEINPDLQMHCAIIGLRNYENALQRLIYSNIVNILRTSSKTLTIYRSINPNQNLVLAW